MFILSVYSCGSTDSNMSKFPVCSCGSTDSNMSKFPMMTRKESERDSALIQSWVRRIIWIMDENETTTNIIYNDVIDAVNLQVTNIGEVPTTSRDKSTSVSDNDSCSRRQAVPNINTTNLTPHIHIMHWVSSAASDYWGNSLLCMGRSNAILIMGSRSNQEVQTFLLIV